jgi:hypothetical protein
MDMSEDSLSPDFCLTLLSYIRAPASRLFAAAKPAKIPHFHTGAGTAALAAHAEKSYKHQNISENMAKYYQRVANKRRP